MKCVAFLLRFPRCSPRIAQDKVRSRSISARLIPGRPLIAAGTQADTGRAHMLGSSMDNLHFGDNCALLRAGFEDENDPIRLPPSRPLNGGNFLRPGHYAAAARPPTVVSFSDSTHALNRAQDPAKKFLRPASDSRLMEKMGRERYRELP